MSRTIIDIPDNQLRDVDALCKLLKISRAEAVRRALQDFVKHNNDVNADGFGLWGAAVDDRDALLTQLVRGV